VITGLLSSVALGWHQRPRPQALFGASATVPRPCEDRRSAPLQALATAVDRQVSICRIAAK
jgi:hypothetical protein